MPIKFTRIPAPLRAAFLQAARDLFHKETALLADIAAHPKNLTCLRIFTLSGEALLSAQSLDEAKPAGFRLLYLSPEFALAADSPAQPADPPIISSFSRSPQLRETAEFILRQLESIGIPPDVTYTAHLLRISSCFLEACWLRPPAPHPDLLIPTITALKEVKARGFFQTEFVLASARTAAMRYKETGGNRP